MSDREDSGPADIPKLRKYVEWVEEQDKLPESSREWEQGAWFWRVRPRDSRGRWVKTQEPNLCGTKCCVAGRVALDDGLTLSHGGIITSAPLGMGEWVGKPVALYAKHVLGLSTNQANALFAAGNSAEMVRAVAEEAAGERL